MYLHGLIGQAHYACFLQISRGRGQPHISQEVDGTSTVILVSLLPLKVNSGNQAVGEFGIEMVDLQGIEDEHERAKTLSRRLEEDKKKALRMKEIEDKAARKEVEKLQKS